MNTRQLTARESAGLAAFNGLGVPSALLFLTRTGLKKSILDATEPMRRFFKRHGVHDYDGQQQGQEHKVLLKCVLLEPSARRDLQVSLYRPNAKSGDPRLWPCDFKLHASPDDVVLVGVVRGTLHFANLTRHDWATVVASDARLREYLGGLGEEANAPSQRLLSLLRELASRGPLEAIGHGATTVGMTVERALGIEPNSIRSPDFYGIEIKAGRAPLNNSRGTRATLFACVPDWDISVLKSSREILDTLGYDRERGFKLYCTVSAARANPQGLILSVDEARQLLREMHKGEGKPSDVVAWRLGRLEDYLASKHRETFWIKVRVEKRSGREWFQLHSVLHTQSPNLAQLHRLLADGGITVDHLIKRTPSGGAREKGPLFKIERPKIPELFLGEPRAHKLT